jgi:hypothetical protein
MLFPLRTTIGSQFSRGADRCYHVEKNVNVMNEGIWISFMTPGRFSPGVSNILRNIV